MNTKKVMKPMNTKKAKKAKEKDRYRSRNYKHNDDIYRI